MELLQAADKDAAHSSSVPSQQVATVQKKARLLDASAFCRRVKPPPKSRNPRTGSTIVYVWRRDETVSVCTYLKSAGVLGGVVSYHAGMDSADRERAQNQFLRFVVLYVSVLCSTSWMIFCTHAL